MNIKPLHFPTLATLIHWVMAMLFIAMLFIGAGMVASVSARHEWLVSLHKPLGIAILALVIVRIAIRLKTTQPVMPKDLPWWQVITACLSHYLLYTLMVTMPLIGWVMISAAGTPTMLGQ